MVKLTRPRIVALSALLVVLLLLGLWAIKRMPAVSVDHTVTGGTSNLHVATSSAVASLRVAAADQTIQGPQSSPAVTPKSPALSSTNPSYAPTQTTTASHYNFALPQTATADLPDLGLNRPSPALQVPQPSVCNTGSDSSYQANCWDSLLAKKLPL